MMIRFYDRPTADMRPYAQGMQNLYGAAVAAACLLALVGCAAPADPASAPTIAASAMSEEATPSPTPTPTATPPVISLPPVDDRVAALRTVAPGVTAVEETEPGRWEIKTNLTDPRSGPSSPEAQSAIAACEKAVELGASKVSVMEADGSTFVVFGHPSFGDVCTEI